MILDMKDPNSYFRLFTSGFDITWRNYLFTGDREIKNSWKIQDLVRSLYSFTTPSIKSIWCFSWIVLDMTDFSWVLQVKQIKIFLKQSTLLKRTSLLKFISRSSILDQVCCWWLHLLLRFYHYPSNYVLAWCCSVYLFFYSFLLVSSNVQWVAIGKSCIFHGRKTAFISFCIVSDCCVMKNSIFCYESSSLCYFTLTSSMSCSLWVYCENLCGTRAIMDFVCNCIDFVVIFYLKSAFWFQGHLLQGWRRFQVT